MAGTMADTVAALSGGAPDPELADDADAELLDDAEDFSLYSDSQKKSEAEPMEEDAELDQEGAGNTPDDEMKKIEKEKEGMSVVEKLERSILWKAEGNDSFKKNDIFKAADSYYHAILYARDLTQNPQFYPNTGHTQEQRKLAQDLCESIFANLALVQIKWGATLTHEDTERPKVYGEAVKSCSEALKLNPKNVKALYRRGAARASLAQGPVKNAEGQKLLSEARTDLHAVAQADPSNREARAELKLVQDMLKKLKQEQIAGEKKEFSFAGTISGMGSKQKDLLKDGSIKKLQTTEGNGEKWFNPDWLKWDGPTKCVVHIKVDGGTSTPVTISYILGDPEMHEGINVAVKSMTPGEVANFTFVPEKLTAKSPLVKVLPHVKDSPQTWEITFVKFVTWEDLDRNGEKLQKIHEEGYGNFPEALAELHVHWRVHSLDGVLIHSTRYVLSMGGEGQGGLKQVEDEDKPATICTLGENAWGPLTIICKSLRQGGVGELRLKTVPELPKQDSGPSGTSDNTSAQLSMMMNKHKKGETLEHCYVRVELERVVQPITGPEDPRWEGVVGLVQERFLGEQLSEKGEEPAAIARFQRVIAWGEQLPADSTVIEEIAAARSSIGWILARRAAPVLDAGNVSSKMLAAANADLATAEEHCKWLEEKRPDMPGAHLLRAKILIAQDDDFEGAHKRLLEAQRLAPDDKRVQVELKEVKVQLRQVQEEQSKAKVVELRDRLTKARTESNKELMMTLLKELSTTKVSWDNVMATRIGVELKNCSQEGGEEAKQICGEILARFKDESKEQRPMWEE